MIQPKTESASYRFGDFFYNGKAEIGQLNRFPNHTRITAETPLPASMTNDCDRVGPCRAVLFGQERPPRRRSHPQYIKVIGCNYVRCDEIFRLLRSSLFSLTVASKRSNR